MLFSPFFPCQIVSFPFINSFSSIMNLQFMIVIYNPSKAKLVNNLRSDCEEGLSWLQTFFAIPTVPIRVSPPPVFYFFYKKFLCNPRQTPHTMTGTKKFQITNGKSKNKKRRRILCQENLQTKQLFQKQKVP